MRHGPPSREQSEQIYHPQKKGFEIDGNRLQRWGIILLKDDGS